MGRWRRGGARHGGAGGFSLAALRDGAERIGAERGRWTPPVVVAAAARCHLAARRWGMDSRIRRRSCPAYLLSNASILWSWGWIPLGRRPCCTGCSSMSSSTPSPRKDLIRRKSKWLWATRKRSRSTSGMWAARRSCGRCGSRTRGAPMVLCLWWTLSTSREWRRPKLNFTKSRGYLKIKECLSL